MSRLFVYGTLQRERSNHDQLAGQRFLSLARTPPGWTLYDLGNYPGLVRAPADPAGVAGELWEVDAAALGRLDEFEGVAIGLYRRETLTLADPAGVTADAYVYLPAIAGRRQLGERWSE
jgi:gamma-glutamylcyclotransferase (GGCT)/AIG2-like uncharacterized protein YtfP